MKININYPQLAAEFVIVFLGVGLALAADSYRENLQESSLESDYLVRLKEDLTAGFTSLEYGQNEIIQAYDAVDQLAKILEEKPITQDDNEIITYFILSSRIATAPDQLVHDTAYRELISTGRLNILQSSEIRSELDRYYRTIGTLSSIREAYPRTILFKFNELTGTGPYRLTWRDLQPNQRSKILNEISDDPEILRDLLRLKAGLEPLIFGLDNGDGRYGRQIARNIELRNRLQSRLLEGL